MIWRAPKEYRDLARLVAFKKRAAEKRGDRQAALYLIQEFVNKADVFERTNTPHFERLALRFVARAMREILKGRAPNVALCLDAEGRRRVPETRDFALALKVSAEYRKVLDRADRPLDVAVRRIAETIKQRGREAPVATVARAVKQHGGIREVCRMADEFGYQPDAELLRAKNQRKREELQKQRKGKQTRK